MAANFSKSVLGYFIDTWFAGDGLAPLFSDMSAPGKGRGDSVDIPTQSAPTVNSSATAAVETVSDSANTLIIDQTAFLNVNVPGYDALLKLDGGYGKSTMDNMSGELVRQVDRNLVEFLIRNASLADHLHLVADANLAVEDADVNATVARMMGQRGARFSELAWFVSPQASAALQDIANNIPVSQAQDGVLGTPPISTLNGIPVYQSQVVPGFEDASRLTTTTSAVSVTSNVATATVPVGHGFVAGQLIYTSGLTTNVPVGTPVQISSTTSNSIVYPLTTTDGALADGVGVIHSASAMALLVHRPWAFFASASPFPGTKMVDREGADAVALQMAWYFGRARHAGACKILHLPDGA